MSRTYKTLNASETVDRLRAGDYVDEDRTADIIIALSDALAASTAIAALLMEHSKHPEAREALRTFCEAAKRLRDRGMA